MIKATLADWISVIECVAFEMIGDRRKCDEVLNRKESGRHETRNGRINVALLSSPATCAVVFSLDSILEEECQMAVASS